MESIQLIHSTLAAFALSLTIISAWIKRSPWIWGGFLILAFSLGALAHIFTPIALIPIGALLILHAVLKSEFGGWTRFALVCATVLISLGLLLHKWPGFHNWLIIDKMQTSEGAKPFSIHLNFDKPFIGLFVLLLGFPLLKDLREFGQMLKKAVPLSICGTALMIALALYSGLVAVAPKFPKAFWFFAIENLLFVCIIEEAFWRGFLQNEFFRWFGGKGFIANIGCILATALLFAVLHFGWVSSIPFLGLVLSAGVIYGSIYQFTRSLEASILCHWLFNVTHFLFFTYPVLESAL